MLLSGDSGRGWQQEVGEALRSRRVDGAVLVSNDDTPGSAARSVLSAWHVERPPE
jgi:hypothetical protein